MLSPCSSSDRQSTHPPRDLCTCSSLECPHMPWFSHHSGLCLKVNSSVMPSLIIASKIAPPSSPCPPTPITFGPPFWHLFFLKALTMTWRILNNYAPIFCHPAHPQAVVYKLYKAKVMIWLVHFVSSVPVKAFVTKWCLLTVRRQPWLSFARVVITGQKDKVSEDICKTDWNDRPSNQSWVRDQGDNSMKRVKG